MAVEISLGFAFEGSMLSPRGWASGRMAPLPVNLQRLHLCSLHGPRECRRRVPTNQQLHPLGDYGSKYGRRRDGQQRGECPPQEAWHHRTHLLPPHRMASSSASSTDHPGEGSEEGLASLIARLEVLPRRAVAAEVFALTATVGRIILARR